MPRHAACHIAAAAADMLRYAGAARAALLTRLSHGALLRQLLYASLLIFVARCAACCC